MRPKNQRAVSPLEPSVVSQKENRTGMVYSMFYGSKRMETAGVPPTARASLAQNVVIHRVQFSTYDSVTGFPQRLSMAAGYPFVKVLTLLGGAPNPNQTPANSNNLGSPSAGVMKTPLPQPIQKGGTMAPLPRFKKALPLPINDYQPPVY